MPDYRSMYDRDYLGHWDLMGKDVTVTISRVTGGELTAPGGRKSKKPVVFFEGKEKGLVLNRTNGKAVAAMYGTDTDAWIGKRVTLYATTTMYGADTVECIRIRPEVPVAELKAVK